MYPVRFLYFIRDKNTIYFFVNNAAVYPYRTNKIRLIFD